MWLACLVAGSYISSLVHTIIRNGTAHIEFNFRCSIWFQICYNTRRYNTKCQEMHEVKVVRSDSVNIWLWPDRTKRCLIFSGLQFCKVFLCSMNGETSSSWIWMWGSEDEDEGKKDTLFDMPYAPPVFPLQHVVALLTVVVLRSPALFITARPECVDLDMLLQEFHIVLPKISMVNWVIADESMTKQIWTITQKYKLWDNCFYLCGIPIYVISR